MQEQVLPKIKDDRLKVFVVWTPAYGTDDNTLAKQGAALAKDKRTRNYWDAKSELALEFGKVVTVPRDSPLAYDVYFVYGPGAEYKGAAPKPLTYMHQILEDERFFEPEKFVKVLKAELAKLPGTG